MEHSRIFSALIVIALFFGYTSCKPDKETEGCTDPDALNYNADATVDDGSCTYEQGEEIVISGDITSSQNWTAINTYKLSGFVYVKEGATLSIEAGTVIKGEKSSKGSLIIERGGVIEATGTSTNPIVFTSDQPAGQRDYGDWGGIIICGRAPVNLPGGEGIVEGGTGATFGGSDPADYSGKLQYVRIEYPGIAFQPNQEINGLTMAAVGNQTKIDHVQVSYSGDDSFEWFGGTVNCSNLIAFRGKDDDFDTDNGFQGKVQFVVGLRDPNEADVSGSNGFESDNDAGGGNNEPHTKPAFTNVSLFGPLPTLQSSADFQFESGLHLRSNTRMRVYNSIIAGYPEGLYVKGNFAQSNATNDDLQVRNSIIAGSPNPLEIDLFSSFDIQTWYDSTLFSNEIMTENDDLMLEDPFNLSGPNFMPKSGSPVLNGADFSNSNLQSSFIQEVQFRGAFGTSDWTSPWANWNPQNTSY